MRKNFITITATINLFFTYRTTLYCFSRLQAAEREVVDDAKICHGDVYIWTPQFWPPEYHQFQPFKQNGQICDEAGDS